MRLTPTPAWAIVTLLAAVGHTPLKLAVQAPLLARGHRLIGYTLVVALVLAAVASALSLLPVRRANAWFAISLGWLVVSSAGGLTDRLGILATAGFIILLVVVVLLLSTSRFLDTLMVAVTVYLVLAPLMSLFEERTLGEVEAMPGYVPVSGTLGALGASDALPDVWLLVLDGYPSGMARHQIFSLADDRLSTVLEGAGFTVQTDALAPYTRTIGALPAVLAGSMVFPPGSSQDPADMAAASEIIGGNSTLVRGLRDVGYHATMIESGWHVSRCSEFIDSCIRSHLIDEMGASLMSVSVLPRVLGFDPHVSTVVGTEHTFNSLERLTESYASNGRPDLVIAHSLAPHPPMLLNERCERQGPELSRSSLLWAYDGWSRDLLAERAENFARQVQCVDALTTAFVQRLPDDDVVVILGDHGTEMQGQVSKIPSEWTEEMLRERLTTLAALRFPGCSTELRATIEVVPTVLRCFGLEVEDPQLTAVIMANVKREDGSEYPLVEVNSQQVKRLLP